MEYGSNIKKAWISQIKMAVNIKNDTKSISKKSKTIFT